MIILPKDIEYIITDFDGVMTDGFVYIKDGSSDFTKRINFKDVMAVSIAQKNGYKVGIISGDEGSIIDYIADKFKLQEVHTNIRNKKEVLQQILYRHNIDKKNVVFIGDDVNDIDCLNYVGFPITVNNANSKVKTVEGIQITEAEGGNGAFREIIDALVD